MAKKLKKSYVDCLPFTTDGKQVFYRDTDLKGFGLRVGTKVKTYFAESKIGRKTVRVTLGEHGVLTTEEARKLAKGRLATMAHDINPNAVEREERAKAITLQAVYDEYIGTRRLKPKTLRDYGACVRRLFHDWRNKPMLNITRDMVEVKHKALSKHGEAQANLAMRLLRWSEVDLTGRAVTFLDTKNGTDFRLPLSDYLVDLLIGRKQAAQSAFGFAGDGGSGHLVEPRRQMEKVIAMSGIEFTLHDLRRTFATIAESLDLSAYALKREVTV